MSIRVRLVLSYIAMLAVPVILSGVAFIIIAIAFMGNLKTLYQVDFHHENPIFAVLEKEAEVSADIQQRASNNPDTLADPKTAQELADRLQQIHMGLIVRKNNDIVFVSPDWNKPQLLRNLPVNGERTVKEDHKWGAHGHWLIVRQHDFNFSDGSRGSAFIVTDTNMIVEFVRNFSSLFFIALFIILVVTNGLLTYFVSRSIIRPLRSLKRAADEIKEGNLDFEIKPESHDEIGELSVSFEQMRRKLKESVELQLQYEENRKELISNISHDLKTPVTAIKGYVEGIIDGVSNSPDKLDKYVKTIYAKAVQMDRLIDELFLFSKLDLKKLPFHFEEVELGSFLRDCYEELHMDMEEKGVSFLLETPGTDFTAWVIADRDKLKRVLTNIIENALKYMDKAQGIIRLRMHDTGDRVVVEVEDNGQGISAEALPHIFDRFYRADPSRNAATGGSGLGLAIVKQIIEEHCGLIWAKSEPGVGTSIYFALKKAAGRRGESNEKNTDH